MSSFDLLIPQSCYENDILNYKYKSLSQVFVWVQENGTALHR